jgi:hypothetical protein
MRIRAFHAVLPFCACATIYGQTLIQPKVFTAPASFGILPGAPAPPPPTREEPKSQLFSTADISTPASNNSQFGVSSRVYSLRVYGLPKCDSAGTCVATTWFDFSVDANVVSAVQNQVSAVREYILSRKGSPLALSLPLRAFTTKKGDVRQSWFAFQPYVSGRFVPVTTGTNKISGGGAVSAGGTGEVHFEFDATEPGSGGESATYPGTLFLSVTPTVAGAFGKNLQSLIFEPGVASSRVSQHFLWGGEYRVGFQFKGKRPISLGITGTYSVRGFTKSHNGIAISLSKLLGSEK